MIHLMLWMAGYIGNLFLCNIPLQLSLIIHGYNTTDNL